MPSNENLNYCLKSAKDLKNKIQNLKKKDLKVKDLKIIDAQILLIKHYSGIEF